MRVLVLIQGELGERLTGPEIRGWEMVRAFAARHEVTAAAAVPEERVRDGIRVVPSTRPRIVRELRRHDVVAGPVLPPYALVAMSRRRRLRVADLYDPVDLEVGTMTGRRARRATASQRAARRLQLRWADVVVSANEAQLARTRADLEGLGRNDGPALLTVPMGLPDPPPAPTARPLRERIAGIGPEDPLVLWWGTAWRWLDAPTAIDAVGRLAESLPDVRMVITAGKPPNAATDPLNATEQARDHARSLGLLDRHVFFLDEWVPFERRHEYIADADVGITLHAGTAEAPLAARARYMDLLWAGLPAVLAEGDQMAARLGDEGAARLVPPHDAVAAARALAQLLCDPAELARARRACAGVADAYRWPTLMAPLVERIESMYPTSTSAAKTLGIVYEAGGYYARRLADRVGPASA